MRRGRFEPGWERRGHHWVVLRSRQSFSEVLAAREEGEEREGRLKEEGEVVVSPAS